MGLSIKESIKKTFTGDVVKQVANHVGENESRVERGIAAAVPAILKQMADTAESDEGLHALQTELDKADSDVTDNFGRRFGETPNIIVERGRSMVKKLFGDEAAKSTASRVASASGIGTVSAEMVTGAVTPVVTGALSKHRQTAGLSAAGLRSALASQLKETSAVIEPSFPPGQDPIRETAAWATWLFPLLALLGLIVLGFSLMGDRTGKGKVANDGESQMVSNADNDGSKGDEKAHIQGEHGIKDHDGAGEHDAAGEGDADVQVAGNSKTDEGSTDGSKEPTGDRDETADGSNVGGSSLAAKTKSKDSAEGEHAVDGTDAHVAGTAKADAGKDSAVGSKEHAGDHGEDGHDAGEHHGDEHGENVADVADQGSKAAAAAAAAGGSNQVRSGVNVAVELPAAVSNATRTLNDVDDVAGAKEAIPKLNKITDRIAELRGDQKKWPDTTQSLVRRRMFALMPALNDSVGKMLDNEEYLEILGEPITNFIGEIDRLVPKK